MIWLYRILFLPVFLVLFPYYLLRMWRRGGYREGFWQRFGGKSEIPAKHPSRRRVWLQAVSVGEIRAMEPLIDFLLQQQAEVILTTTTSTGYALAKEKFSQSSHSLWIRYFPLDFWWFSARTWRYLQPDIALLAEGELWPEHLHQARHRNIPVLLLNGRLSDRSFRRFRHVKRWVGRLLQSFDHILASSDLDAQRFLQLGAQPEKVHVTGNLKLEVPLATPLDSESKRQWCQNLGFPHTDPLPNVLIGASTWPGEEMFLHQLVVTASSTAHPWVLLLVPRHAERGVALRREFAGYSGVRFWNDPLPESTVQTVIADVTGKMRELLAGADLVFAGKSLPPHIGGQTPLEAAATSLPVVAGPHMENFRSLVRDMKKEKVLLQGNTPEETLQYLRQLMHDPALRSEMGIRAGQWLEQQKGTLQRIQRVLLPYL